MAFRNWNLEWLNLNAQRAYPLATDATAQDTQASFTIPDDFIVGLYLPVHSGILVNPGLFHIKTIGIYSSGYSVVVGYAGDTDISIATALIARETFTKNQSYALGGIGEFSDTVGRIVIGSLDTVDKQPAGQFSFNLAGGRLETDVVRPIIRGVSSVQIQNGTTLSERYYGQITFRAGGNMRITAVPASGEDSAELVFDAIEGVGLTDQCVCLEEETATPIYKINGVRPNALGEFVLLGDDCLDIDPITNGLQLNDTCSKPCCGCPELEVVTEAAKTLASKADTLETYLDNLDGQIMAMMLAIGNL